MNLIEQAHRDRQTLLIRELRPRKVERIKVVAYLLHVRFGRAFFSLEGQQVDERRLSPFDLRREQGLLANEGVDELID